MGTAAEDADVRRGLKRSAELPFHDEARDLVRSRGEHLDDDVPIVKPIAQRAGQAADATDAHMSVGTRLCMYETRRDSTHKRASKRTTDS